MRLVLVANESNILNFGCYLNVKMNEISCFRPSPPNDLPFLSLKLQNHNSIIIMAVSIWYHNVHINWNGIFKGNFFLLFSIDFFYLFVCFGISMCFFPIFLHKQYVLRKTHSRQFYERQRNESWMYCELKNSEMKSRKDKIRNNINKIQRLSFDVCAWSIVFASRKKKTICLR